MSGNPFHRAIYLTGPTASGKTAVGVALAEMLGAEIVALDSMTLYRGLDIGTAKPTRAERRGVPHHLIDVLEPHQAASVADYRGWAAEAVAGIETRGRRALFVGGTPLYLKTLLRGLFEGPPADPALRAELDAWADLHGDEALHRRLAEVDPASAARLHPNDRRRLIRALEVHRGTGLPLSAWQTEHDRSAPASVAVFALARPRAEVHRRIDARVLGMFADGLLDEVRRLRALDPPLHPVPAQGVGYREVLELLEASHESSPSDLAVTIGRIQARTRQFAKRQETWFRGLTEVRSFPVPDHEPTEVTAERLFSTLREGMTTG